MRPGSSRRSFASEYAASARDAGCFGERSSSSLPCGWFTRSPRRRAIGLGAEHVGRLEARVPCREPDRPRRRKQAGGRDELRVELPHRHDPRRVGGRPVRLARARRSPRAAPRASAGRRAGTRRRSAPSRRPGRPRRSAARPSSATCGCVAPALRVSRPGSDAPAVAVHRDQRGERARERAERDVCHHPYLPVSDGDSAGLDRGPADANGIRTFHGTLPMPAAVEPARGAGDDPRLGALGGAGRAGRAMDDALLLRGATGHDRRGRAERGRPPRRAPARGGRRPAPAARPVRPRCDRARRRPRHARAARAAARRSRARSCRRWRGFAAPASRSRSSLADHDLAWQAYATSLLAEALADD